MKFLSTVVFFASGSLVAAGQMISHEHIHKSYPRISASNPPNSNGLKAFGADIGKATSPNCTGVYKSTLNSSITAAQTEFIVPNVTVPQGQDAKMAYAVNVWLGIGAHVKGDNCTGGGVEVGVMLGVRDNKPRYQAWYKLNATDQHLLSTPLNGGDDIELSIQILNKEFGTVSIKNYSNLKRETKTFAIENRAICQSNAEWIIERYNIKGLGAVPFADFGSLTFNKSSVTVDGYQEGLDGARVLAMVDEKGETIADCDLKEDESTVQCDYKAGLSG